MIKAIAIWLKRDSAILECVANHLYVLVDRFSDQQLEVLKLAHKKGGKVTVDEIALKLRYSLNQVQKLLKSLENLGVVYSMVEKGVKYWYFPALWKGSKTQSRE